MSELTEREYNKMMDKTLKGIVSKLPQEDLDLLNTENRSGKEAFILNLKDELEIIVWDAGKVIFLMGEGGAIYPAFMDQAIKLVEQADMNLEGWDESPREMKEGFVYKLFNEGELSINKGKVKLTGLTALFDMLDHDKIKYNTLLRCSNCRYNFNTWIGYKNQNQSAGMGICKKCQQLIDVNKNKAAMNKCVKLIELNLLESNSIEEMADFNNYSRSEKEEFIHFLINKGVIVWNVKEAE